VNVEAGDDTFCEHGLLRVKTKADAADVNFSTLLPRQLLFSVFNKAMKKLIKIAVLLVLLLIIAVALGIHFYLDSAVKKAVEKVGPEVTGVSVKLDSVSILLFAGSTTVKGLVVGNPEGFKSPSSISVAKTKVDIKPSSIFSDKIIINTISIDAPEITFEQNGLIKNNLNELRKKVSSSSPPSAGKTEPAKGEKSAGKKLQVDEFIISNGKVHVLANIPGVGEKAMTVPLPLISQKNLGTGPDGITAAELSKIVLDLLLEKSGEEAAKAVTDLGKNSLIMGGKNISGKITDGVNGLLKKKK